MTTAANKNRRFSPSARALMPAAHSWPQNRNSSLLVMVMFWKLRVNVRKEKRLGFLHLMPSNLLQFG
jgi:hypothetical protein